MKRMIVAETEIGKICNLKWTEKNGQQAYAEVEKISPRKYRSTTYGDVFRLDNNGEVYKEGKLIGTNGKIYC